MGFVNDVRARRDGWTFTQKCRCHNRQWRAVRTSSSDWQCLIEEPVGIDKLVDNRPFLKWGYWETQRVRIFQQSSKSFCKKKTVFKFTHMWMHANKKKHSCENKPMNDVGHKKESHVLEHLKIDLAVVPFWFFLEKILLFRLLTFAQNKNMALYFEEIFSCHLPTFVSAKLAGVEGLQLPTMPGSQLQQHKPSPSFPGGQKLAEPPSKQRSHSF